MNRCRRCNRELKDENAVYGWRCAEILGVSEKFYDMDEDAFNRFTNGVLKARELLEGSNLNLNEKQKNDFSSAYARMSLWDGIDKNKVKEAKKDASSVIELNSRKTKDIKEELDDYQKESKYKKALDNISNFLAAASIIPVIDSATNLAAIPVDLLRGDFLAAGLDLLGVFPFVGELGDGAKLVDKAVDTAKVADKASDAAKAGKVTRKAVKKVTSVDDNIEVVTKKFKINEKGFFGKMGENCRVIEDSDPIKASADFYEMITRGGVEEPLLNGKGVQTIFDDDSRVIYRVITSTPNSPAVEIKVINSDVVKSQKIHFIK